MKNVITKIESVKLAQGLQQILLDMARTSEDPHLPVAWLKDLIVKRKQVDKTEAERVIEAVINTGILRWELGRDALVL